MERGEKGVSSLRNHTKTLGPSQGQKLFDFHNFCELADHKKAATTTTTTTTTNALHVNDFWGPVQSPAPVRSSSSSSLYIVWLTISPSPSPSSSSSPSASLFRFLNVKVSFLLPFAQWYRNAKWNETLSGLYPPSFPLLLRPCKWVFVPLMIFELICVVKY